MLSPVFRRLGELNCRVFAPANTPNRAIVLCHGFGAPGTDLVPLAGELCRYDSSLAADTLFVFPEAPLVPREFKPFGGRAWWPLDMERLQAAIQSGQMRDLRGECPARLPAARAELISVLVELTQSDRLPVDRIVIGGFSQGSMLATDVALQFPATPAGLVIYSGTLLNEVEWTRQATHRRGMPVLQSHGTEDPILSFAAAEWLRDMLSDAGLSVEFQSFCGGHTIPAAALVATARMLARLD
jgi:phospholipase/carboxylesterase